MNKPLGQEIIEMAQKDQEVRLRAVKEQWPRKKRLKIRDIDTAHRVAMKRIIADYGWPTITMVGKKAAHAAWLLVQHADEDPVFQQACLKMMQGAFGKEEVFPEDVAHLTDRVLFNLGKKQTFGTQFRLHNGVREPYPIFNPKDVDKRRIAYGLPPIAVATRKHNALLKKSNKV